MSFTFFIKFGKGEASETDVFGLRHTWGIIGRQDAELVLQDPWCSKHHALVYVDSKGVPRLKDLRSRNGTYLNGRRIDDAVLQPGDEILIGHTKIAVIKVPTANEKRRQDPPILPVAKPAPVSRPPDGVVLGWPTQEELRTQPRIRVPSGRANRRARR